MGQSAGSPAEQLEERYFRQKVMLGQGSFSTVWRAVDRETGAWVAIKQLEKVKLHRRGMKQGDIENEIGIMRVCKQENLLQLFNSFEDHTNIYLALEYCEGGDFGDKLREKGIGIEEGEAAAYVRQMCDAVCALHSRNVVHRDIKPDNFMVSDSRPGGILKLADFGMAISVPGDLPKETRVMLQQKCGTPGFMAPEVHLLTKGSPGYGFPVDMWAVGVSMYMVMFGGRHPFISERFGLDIDLLLVGRLDFGVPRSVMGISGTPRVGDGLLEAFGLLRFSEEARQLCSRMVDTDPYRRLQADEAVCSPWLQRAADRKDLQSRTSTSSKSSRESSMTSCLRQLPTPTRAHI